MKNKKKVFEYDIKTSKMKDMLLFMKRLIPLLSWLKERYDLSNDIELEYYFREGQQSRKTITIKITFE